MAENTQSADSSSTHPDSIQCYCRSDGIIDLLGRKYAIPVICLVGVLEPARYAEIEDELAEVSSSTLSTRLEELTEAGLLHRERYAEIPPRVEYTVTDDGETLCKLLTPLLEWAERRDDCES